MSSVALSVLDLVPTYQRLSPAEAFAASVTLAQLAEQHGFQRVWYAEHHNFPSIASAAPAVLISHIAAHTSRIRVGAGGVMLPNHSPYVVAEQFGTLAHLYPERIDLGLGRAPGTDGDTVARALRRSPLAAQSFESDVKLLRGFLSETSPIDPIVAFPGQGTNVPLYILGSSLFGATVAARLGLPFVFASHFAPQLLIEATELYRREFQPSDRWQHPFVMASVNVVAAATSDIAQQRFEQVQRSWIRAMMPSAKALSDAGIDQLIHSGMAGNLTAMLSRTGVGDGATVVSYLRAFAAEVDADELIISFRSNSTSEMLESLDIVAKHW